MIVGHIGGAGSPYEIQKSLRFRASASAYLSRTPTVAGNRKTWTWSGWVKRGATGAAMHLFSSATNPANQFVCQFSTGNALEIVDYRGGVTQTGKISSALFRDPSSHYHIVLQVDTTQAIAEDRFKIFVNGTRLTAFSTNTVNTLQNADLDLNQSGTPHRIGDSVFGGGPFDGYLSEINFIDGQALGPSYFGEFFAETGAWIPKKYTGTYGTNGFYLPFNDGSTLGNLTADRSGNGNNWTANNISLTAGSSYDWMDDTPTNNFCTLNPLSSVGSSYHNVYGGNLNWQTNTSVGGSSYNATDMTFRGAPSSGLWYYEFVVNQINAANTGYIYHLLANCYIWWVYGGTYQIVGSNGTTSIGSISSGDVIQVAVDSTNGKMWYGRNGTWYTVSGTPDPAAGTGASSTFTPTSDPTYFSIQGRTGNVVQDVSFNFGQRPFAYTPPAGFKALCTKNLPTPSILNPKKHFDVLTYVGNGVNSANALTVTGAKFQPGFSWLKSRSIISGHVLQDVVRGLGNFLMSDATTAEQITGGGDISAYNADGFTVSYNNARSNQLNATYAAGLWKAGGAPVTNNAGSIQSQVSANPQAGFSIVTYTGNNTNNATVGHGLGIAPKMVVVKARTGTTNWAVMHSSLTADNQLFINLTNSQSSISSGSAGGISTSVTSSVFTTKTGSTNLDNVNDIRGYVAYCFAEIPGYSKIGSYTGNGSADGPFVYCGFRPKFVLWKNASVVSNWAIEDTSRSTYNQMQDYLLPNLSAAEGNASTVSFDFTANGFKVRGADSGLNGSGNTIIFIAFAEAPFQFANAR